MIRKNVFLMITLSLLVTACATDSPRYKSFWVYSQMEEEEMSLAWDLCSLQAGRAETDYRNSRGQQNPNTTGGALYNYTTSLGASEVRKKTFSVCMRLAGFRYESRCVRNCN